MRVGKGEVRVGKGGEYEGGEGRAGGEGEGGESRGEGEVYKHKGWKGRGEGEGGEGSTQTSTKVSDNPWVHGLIGASLSKPHTNIVNGAFSLIILSSHDHRHTVLRYALYSTNIQITFTTEHMLPRALFHS